MKNLNVIIAGDLHGEWGELNKLINKKKPDVILQAGDFGWWPHFHGKSGLLPKKKIFNQFGIKNSQNGKLTKIYWIPGNHENWDDLKCITDYEPLEIQHGITYCPFGTVLKINDYKILMVGGAASTDAQYRTEGISWWKNEVITQEDIDNLPDCEIDVVISHTLPRSWIKSLKWKFTDRHRDQSSFALDLIKEKYKPKKWFCGHFHYFIKQNIDGCDLTVLSIPKNLETWWMYLK